MPLEIEVVEDHSNVENIFRRRDPPKYDVFGTEVPSERLPLTFEFVNGVAQICSQENPDTPLTHFSVFTFDEFLRDFNTVQFCIYIVTVYIIFDSFIHSLSCSLWIS